MWASLNGELREFGEQEWVDGRLSERGWVRSVAPANPVTPLPPAPTLGDIAAAKVEAQMKLDTSTKLLKADPDDAAMADYVAKVQALVDSLKLVKQ